MNQCGEKEALVGPGEWFVKQKNVKHLLAQTSLLPRFKKKEKKERGVGVGGGK